MKTMWEGQCPKCTRPFVFHGEDNSYKCLYCDKMFKVENNSVVKQSVFKPRKASEIPDCVKIKKFDELYNSARETYNEMIENGYIDEDTPHYMFEEMMNLLGGKEMWDSYNNAEDSED